MQAAIAFCRPPLPVDSAYGAAALGRRGGDVRSQSLRCWRLIDCFWAARCCMTIRPLATGRQSMSISDSFGMSAASGCPDALGFSRRDYPRFADIRLSARRRLNKHYMYVSAELLRRKTNKRWNHTDHVHQPEIKEARRKGGGRTEGRRETQESRSASDSDRGHSAAVWIFSSAELAFIWLPACPSLLPTGLL